MLWTPKLLSRGANAWWWDASYAPSLTLGFGAPTGVAEWRDRLRGVPMLPSGLSGFMLRDARGPMVRCYGNGGLRTAASAIALTSLSAMSVWAVGEISGTNGYQRVVSYLGSEGQQDYASALSFIPVLGRSDNSGVGNFRGSDAAWSLHAVGVPFVAASFMFDSTTVTNWQFAVNGRPKGMVYAAGIVGNMGASGRLAVGIRADGYDAADALTGNVREVIVISGRVADKLSRQIEGYLAHKWNIPLAGSHPYAQRAPVVGPLSGVLPASRYSSVTMTVRARALPPIVAPLNPVLPLAR